MLSDGEYGDVFRASSTLTRRQRRKKERKNECSMWETLASSSSMYVLLFLHRREWARGCFLFFSSFSLSLSFSVSDDHRNEPRTSLLIWLVNLVVVGLDGAVVLFLSRRRRRRLSRTLRKCLAQCHCWPTTKGTEKKTVRKARRRRKKFQFPLVMRLVLWLTVWWTFYDPQVFFSLSLSISIRQEKRTRAGPSSVTRCKH